MSRKKDSIDKDSSSGNVKSGKKNQATAGKAAVSSQQTIETNTKKASSIWNIVILAALAVLLFYSPYFRGLYFNEEMSTTFLYTGIMALIFIVYKLLNRDFRVFKSPLDAAAGVLVLAYFIPIVLGQAASSQYAWDKFLRYVNYFMVYLVARDLIVYTRYLTVLLNAVVVSAIGVSILGIDAGAGMIVTNSVNWFFKSIPEFLNLQGGLANLMSFKFFGGFTEGRIYSTLQYPNVLASYLGAVFILITGMLMTSGAVWKRFLYGAAGFIVFYTFMLTISRGMFLVLPVMVLIFLIVLWKKRLIVSAIVDAGIPALTGAVLSIFYHGFINTGQYWMVWVSVAGGVLTAGILAAASGLIKDSLSNISTKVYAIGAGIAALLLVMFVGISLNIEKPLVIKHEAGEANSEKYVIRDITDIKPETKYSLQFNIDAVSPAPDKDAYRIVVSSINRFAEVKNLTEVKGGTEKTIKKLDFTTGSDTNSIRIYMSNYNAGTSAAFSGFKLRNPGTGGERPIVVEYKYLPTDIVYKVKDISLKTHNAWQRFVFVGDAFNIIRDYPLGAGGGGWKALYQKYQSYGYSSNEVHNHPVQLWVETGIIGIAALAAVGWLIIFQFYRTRRDMNKTTPDDIRGIVITCAVFAAVLSLYAHSVIDFDLSLSALSLLVWTLTGFISAFYIQREGFGMKLSNGANAVSTVIAGVLVLTLVWTGFSSVYGRAVLGERYKYANGITQEQIDTAVPEITNIYERYLALQPLDERNRLDYIRFNNEVAKNVPQEKLGEYLERMKQNVDALASSEPNSLNSLIQAASFYVSVGDFEKGLAYADRAVESARFLPQAYRLKAEVYLIAGQLAMSHEMADTGRVLLETAMNIRTEMDEASKLASKPMDITPEIEKEFESIQQQALQLMLAPEQKPEESTEE